MRSGGWLVLSAALCATAAAAQPQIVDPTPDDPTDKGWQLSLDPVMPNGTLQTPTSMVFVGTKADEEMLVLEKNTGKVRHFKNRAELPLALDLDVDNCGERGLLGIALHPNFARATSTIDPEHPDKNWVYLSYHTGPIADGCSSTGVTLRVERYVWNGSTLTLDNGTYGTGGFEPFQVQDLPVDASTAVGGVVAATNELQFSPGLAEVPFLYIATGSLGHDGALQNNRAADPNALDDTGVLMRFDQNGAIPIDNPFDDPDDDTVHPQDRYSAYGIRDPKAIAVDPVAGTLWFSEQSDGAKDEINSFLPGSNGGYSVFQGFEDPKAIPANTDPTYPLVDLLKQFHSDPALVDTPVKSYLNPRFEFDEPTLDLTGVAFGGTEVGPQHNEDLFVGTTDGRLFRFPVEPLRSGFLLTGDLADDIAQIANDTAVPPRPADDLTQILIATGFGAISGLQTGVDGSIYVIDQTNGTIYRVFFNAKRDMSIIGVKVPSKISLSAAKPTVSKSIKLTLVNNGEVPERIDNVDELTAYLGLQITPTGTSTCAPIVGHAVTPWYGFPIGFAVKRKVALEVAVDWACDGGTPTPKGVPDFDVSFHLDDTAIGIHDQDPDNDVCPRPPDPAATPPDPGCGPKGGGEIVTDITLK